MADGYISQIKTPDNKVYLLKDSEKTDEKVKQTSNTEDKEFPILFKNANNATEETAGVKYSGNITADATTTKPFTFNPSTGNLTVTQLKIGTKNDNMGLFPNLNNWNQIGASNLYWYRSYINNYYGSRSHVDNWDSGKNIGTAATSSAAATKGTVNFYNTAAANATQTKTLLEANANTNSNIIITLPSSTGTLALTSQIPTNLNQLTNGPGYVTSSGITSVTIGATSPVQSSTSTAQTGSSASTTISLKDAYGDTKNPYGSKTKNYVLAAPSNANGVPSFRALVAADMPDLSGTYVKKVTSTDNAIARFDGTSGQIQNSKVILDDNGNIIPDATDTYSLGTASKRWNAYFAPKTIGGRNYIYSTPIAGSRSTIEGKTVVFNPNANNGDSYFYVKAARDIPVGIYTFSMDCEGLGANEVWAFGIISQNSGKVISVKNGRSALTFEVTTAITAETKIILDDIGRPTTSTRVVFSNFMWEAATSPSDFSYAPEEIESTYAKKIASTKYGIAYYSDTDGTFAGTGTGTSGQYLKSNGNSAPTWATFSASTVGLGNVENTKLSTWAGSSNITTVGTISTGTWHGTKIANDYIANPKVTIAGNDVSLGGNLTAATLTSSLGLSNALHFIGITSTALTDGSTTATLTAKSTDSLSKTTGFVDGDVVMDGDQLREYVWSGSAWRLLGITTSTAYTQPASTATNTWIAQVNQGTDGKITATTGSLNTSGTWSGNAATATSAGKWTTARTLTIGNTGKSVDGSGNVSWSLADIGAATSGHNHNGTYVPNTAGANDVNTLYNTGIYNITSGSLTNGPRGYGFGQLLVMSYRKHTGNTTTDWATQIYSHLGSGNNGNTLYYRTSNANTWQTWQMAAHADAGTAKGGAKKPIYIDAQGVIQEGTELKNLAYKDSLTASDVGAAPATHTHNYAGSSSAGSAATSANALNFVHTNEILIGNANSQAAIHINHRRVSGGATSGNTAITDYYFKNGNGAITGVKIHAETFNGNASTASALKDAGNNTSITAQYSGAGASATDWFTEWNGYKLVAVSSTDVANKVRDKASGSWGISVTGSAANISSKTPTLAASTENNEITVIDLGNDSPVSGAAQRHAIDFRWYNSHWAIGNLRSGSTPSAGFGFSYSSDSGTTYSNLVTISTDGKITATGGFSGNLTGTVTGNATNVTGTVAIGNGGTGATTAANARTNLGLGTAATYNITGGNEGYSSTATLIPRIGTDGVMEVGKYIDFHAATGTSKDYDVRITAATTGLTISGTTSGTFNGNLTGNVTGNVSGTAANVTGTVAIDHGGTGATTASAAWTALGGGASGKHADNYFVMTKGNAGKSNMNDVGRMWPSSGMTNLTSTSNADTPKNGDTYSSGWHLYWDTCYSDDPNASNAWVAQIVNKAGTSQWWVRSRSGSTITNGTAWASSWRHLVTSTEAAVGGATQPVYINANGEVVAGTVLKALAYKDSLTASDVGAAPAVTGGYLPLSGGTLTGALTTANNTWNVIGDDCRLGDINKAGHMAIQGVNGNTGIFFTTYNQNTKTTGGAITWNGTNFSITSDTAIAGTITNSTNATNATNATALYTASVANTAEEGQNARIKAAIKSYFDNNTASVPRGKTISLSISTGNGVQATGYFISGYDSSPYGGFFVSHYDTPRYVGISNGNYSCYELVRNNGGTYSINVSGTAGGVAWTNVSGRPTNLNQFTNGPGYVTSSGVTKVSTGAGLTGGDITTTGTISINGMNTSSGATNKWLNQKGEWTTPPNDNTHHTAYLYAGANNATAHAAVSSGTNIYLCLRENGSQRSAVQIKQGSNMTISSDASGIITFAAKDTTYSNFVKSGVGAAAGLVPSPGTTAGSTKYLREDGTWAVPPDTKYTLTAATTSALGGIQLGYSENGKNYPVELSNNKAFVNVPWTDTNNAATHTLNTAAKYYVTGTTSASTSTSGDTFDTGIYATTTAGQLNATTFKVNEHVTLQYNTTDSSLEFVFA